MTCHTHPEKIARFVCEGCEKNWCEGCVRSFHAGQFSSYICGQCGGACSVLTETPAETSPSLGRTTPPAPPPLVPPSQSDLAQSEQGLAHSGKSPEALPVEPAHQEASASLPVARAQDKEPLPELSTMDTGRIDLAGLTVGAAAHSSEAQTANAEPSILATPPLLSLFRDFFVKPALSFPNGMYHLNKSPGFRRRFGATVAGLFGLVLFLKWMSSSGGSLPAIAGLVSLEALIFTGLLTGIGAAFHLGQVRFPLSCAWVVLGTHLALLALREACFLFLPFLGKTSVVLCGTLWLLVKLWVFGTAYVKGFRCEPVSAFLLLAVSFLGTAVTMTLVLKACHA